LQFYNVASNCVKRKRRKKLKIPRLLAGGFNFFMLSLALMNIDVAGDETLFSIHVTKMHI
jgi:hypothetical protein